MRDLPPLVDAAWVATPEIAAVAVLLFVWANRRLPEPVAVSSRVRRVRLGLERAVRGAPSFEAGGRFALQVLFRSPPHRTIVAGSLAIGVTHGLMRLGQHAVSASAVDNTLGLLAVAPGLVTTLLVGLRYAVTVPGAPTAGWIVRIAWQGDERLYREGVKRAALVLVGAVLLILTPVHVATMGVAVAMLHTWFVLLLGGACLEAGFLVYRAVPFACAYRPIENPKLVWPATAVGLLLVTYGFAVLEHWALGTLLPAVGFSALLAGVVFSLRLVDRVVSRTPTPVLFEERPTPHTQRLGLYDHVMGID